MYLTMTIVTFILSLMRFRKGIFSNRDFVVVLGELAAAFGLSLVWPIVCPVIIIDFFSKKE